MATQTQSRSLTQDNERIRSPLDRLRKFIRAYVTLEGAAVALLFLALWFWIGLAIDWGMFKLTGQDLVQLDASRIFRIVVLMGLLGGLAALLAVTVLVRLFVQFSDVAVALVLERQFPKLLGDRLITAVELHDPQQAASYGYSADMVRQTIHEAADRVDQVPVKDAFDWKRLTRRGLAVLGGSVALYMLFMAGFAVARAAGKDGSPTEAFADVNEVSSMFVERNILLRNTIWLRRSYLEVISHDEDVRIPRKSRPDRLVLRAWEYVIADPHEREGWRQMEWADLTAKAGVLGGNAPALPDDWRPRFGRKNVTVDEVALNLEAFPVRKGTGGDATWQVASGGEEGWRALAWKDLTKERLGGLDVPDVPGAWMGLVVPGLLVKGPSVTLSADEVAAKLANAQGLDEKVAADLRVAFARLERLEEIRQALATLDEKLAPRSMRRTARKLIVPGTVTLVSWNRLASTTSSLDREGDNLYTSSWNDIEETTYYRATGEDYTTPTHVFTCVDRPTLEQLLSIEERPAYLYYRPGPVLGPPPLEFEPPTAVELVGKRQKFHPIPVSVSGEATTIDVPAGTTLTLEATATKPLAKVELWFDPKDKVQMKGGPLELGENRRSFSCKVPNVRTTIPLYFLFTDEDGVDERRKVVINPRPDRSPSVRDFSPDDVIRRDKGSYMVSAKARIPFRGRIRDDEGLGRVRYIAVVTPADFLGEQKLKSFEGAGAVGLALSGPSAIFQAVPWLIKVQKDAEEAGGPSRHRNVVPLAGFAAAVRANMQRDDPERVIGRSDYMKAENAWKRLGEAQKDPYRRLYNEYLLNPDNWTDADPRASPWEKNAKGEDRLNLTASWKSAREVALQGDLGLWQLRWRNDKGEEADLAEKEEGKSQKAFLVEVSLEAEDTYLEGDNEGGVPRPNRTPSSETFTFKVVPENELLAEIGKEEEVKFRDMERAFKPLPENRQRMADIYFALGGSAPVSKAEMNNMVARCYSLDEVLKASQMEAKGVFDTYERIVREMRLNQLREDVLKKVLAIHKPLSEVDALYGKVIASAAELHKRLQDPEAKREDQEAMANQVRTQMNDLVTKITKILQLMEGLSTLNKLIQELVQIEKAEGDALAILERIRRRLLEDLLKKD